MTPAPEKAPERVEEIQNTRRELHLSEKTAVIRGSRSVFPETGVNSAAAGRNADPDLRRTVYEQNTTLRRKRVRGTYQKSISLENNVEDIYFICIMPFSDRKSNDKAV